MIASKNDGHDADDEEDEEDEDYDGHSSEDDPIPSSDRVATDGEASPSKAFLKVCPV